MGEIAATLENELTFTRFDQMSRRYPDNTAVHYLGQHFSFSQIRDLSERFAGALVELGVKKGDRVMVYLPNCIQWVVAFLGIQKMGAVIVPVSPIYTSHELDYMIKDSGAETIICQDTNFCYASDVSADSGLKRIIVTNLVDLLPFWKRSLGVLFDKIPNGKVERAEGVFAFKKLLNYSPFQSQELH